MIRLLSIALLAFLLVSAGPQKDRRPLDLPSGGIGSNEVDEDAPEVIEFFRFFEGDAFFWLLDKSGSMNGDAIEIVKLELVEAVSGLSAKAEFSVVVFSGDVQAWSMRPKRATHSNKANLQGWIADVIAGGPTCMIDAAAVVLDISKKAHSRRRQVIILSDGIPTCSGRTRANIEDALYEITRLNSRRTSINTIFVNQHKQSSSIGAKFMAELAELNRGKFKEVEF